jgi:RNA polymerase sigma factor (sigma-70 family)
LDFGNFLSDSGRWRVFIDELMTDGKQLLAEYVKNGSEAAFRDLTGRYTNLVYSVALRMVGGDTQSAEDIAQSVFIDLARMAQRLSPEVMLGGWLHRHTCFVASKAIRSERRRQARERRAAQMNAGEDHSEANLARIAPVIDDAINQLGDEDRLAILLRFFEQQDFNSVGAALGSTADTAQKRVSRALEKLHALLRHGGIKCSVVGLGTLLGAEAITAAPSGLAASLAGTALGAMTAGGGGTLTIAKFIAMTKLKLGVVSALVAVAAIPLWMQHRSVTKLREENESLRLQAQQLAALSAENDRLSNLLAKADSSATPDQSSELLKLRGEVGGLRRQLAEAAKQEKTKAAVPQQSAAQDPKEQQKEVAIDKMNYTGGWMLAFMKYAEDHQGEFPTNFEMATSFLGGWTNANMAPEQFQIVYQGSRNAITNPQSVIVLREKDAWQALDGGWLRAYAFADGHSEIHKTEDGNFEPWEAQHMTAPQAGGQSGQ